MQTNRVQNFQNYTPNFQALKKFKLPTREVLECATGKISQDTIKNPKGILTIFSKLYDIPMKNLYDLVETPLGFNIYTVSSGTIIKANNPDVMRISNKISQMPNPLQAHEIKRISEKIGTELNIVVDDKIKRYNVVNGKIIVGKSDK